MKTAKEKKQKRSMAEQVESDEKKEATQTTEPAPDPAGKVVTSAKIKQVTFGEKSCDIKFKELSFTPDQVRQLRKWQKAGTKLWLIMNKHADEKTLFEAGPKEKGTKKNAKTSKPKD